MRANVTEQVYNTWFKKIGFESYDDKSNTVILQVPSTFVCKYLEENYVDLLRKALYQNFREGVALKYRLVAENAAQQAALLRAITPVGRRQMHRRSRAHRLHLLCLSTRS